MLADYEKECQSRLVAGGDEAKGSLKCKEKGDMVLVSRSGELSGSTSPGKGDVVFFFSLLFFLENIKLIASYIYIEDSSNEDDWEEAVAPIPEVVTTPSKKSPQKST